MYLVKRNMPSGPEWPGSKGVARTRVARTENASNAFELLESGTQFVRKAA